MTPAEIAAAYDAAVAHQRGGRLAEAEELYRAILAAAPNHAESLHMLGGLALQAGHVAAATGLIQRAVAADPRRALFHASLGQAGQADAALQSLRQATALAPDFATAHFLTGLVLQQKGRLDEAAAAFETALRFQPRFPQALFNLGAIAEGRGRGAEAAARYRAALALAPDFAAAHLNLGIGLAAAGDLTVALPHLERAAALAPGLPETQTALGNARLASGDPDKAEAAFRAALAAAPPGPDPRRARAQLGLGNAFRAQGRLEAALVAYGDAAAAEPGLAEALINAGGVAGELGRPAEAERHFRRAIATAPKSALAQAGLSHALAALDRPADALAAAERAVALDPALAEAQTTLGLRLLELDRSDEAAAAFRRALAAAPGFPAALVPLARIAGGGEADGELTAALRSALAAPRLGEADRMALLFALGRRLDKDATADEAFAAIAAANALLARHQPFDLTAFRREVDRLVAVFDGTFFALRQELGSDRARPILVVGLPGAGAGLAARLLARHPQLGRSATPAACDRVIAALNEFPAAARAGKAYPEAAAFLDREGAMPLAQAYLDAVAAGSDADARIVEAGPDTILRLGLLALLFPRATVIHCQRDPFDAALACHFQDAAAPRRFAATLDRLGGYCREYEQLMDHWRQVLPLPVFELPYEELTAAPEAWCRRLLAHCDLPWDARVLEAVGHGRGIGRWRRCRGHLGPLFAALGRTPGADDTCIR